MFIGYDAIISQNIEQRPVLLLIGLNEAAKPNLDRKTKRRGDKMDTEYVAMRRRMSRLRVKCGKGASLEGRVLAFILGHKLVGWLAGLV